VALAGFAGNELAARYRIRTGRMIGSAALVADGLHARADGITSLAVLLGAGGVALGWNWADPVIGLVITVAILAVLRQAAREIYRRLMDAVDPALVDRAGAVVRATPGVLDVGQVRMRWVGHQIRAECEIVVWCDLPICTAAHQIRCRLVPVVVAVGRYLLAHVRWSCAFGGGAGVVGSSRCGGTGG
jgi:cation diffusion facilitator family transporter